MVRDCILSNFLIWLDLSVPSAVLFALAVHSAVFFALVPLRRCSVQATIKLSDLPELSLKRREKEIMSTWLSLS